jgi:mono/diheme cytochrome c family protein
MRPRTRAFLAVTGTALAGLTLYAADTPQAPAAPAVRPAVSRPAAPQAPAMAAAHAPMANENALVKQYCGGCHSDRGKAGGLSLASFDVTAATEHPEVTEKVIRKLRAGMMPPAGARRPEGHCAGRPGHRRSRRASTARRSIRTRAGVPSSASTARSTPAPCATCSTSRSTSMRTCRPTPSATASTTSPTRRRSRRPDGGLPARRQPISTLAVGDRNASAPRSHLQGARTASQMRQSRARPSAPAAASRRGPHLPGRRRVHLPHDAALDSDRQAVRQHACSGEQIEVSINGERVALLDINTRMSETDPNGMNMVTPPSREGWSAARLGGVHLSASTRRWTT